MIDKHSIMLRRIDYTNRKLPVFLLNGKDKLGFKFRVMEDGTEYLLDLGMTEDHSYTDIRFEAGLEINLDLFEIDIPPILKTEHVIFQSAESVKHENLKIAERSKAEKQVKALFPSVLKAFNRFRRACRIALFRGSVAGHVLAHNIRDSELYRGLQVDHDLESLISDDDTDVLFGAFANLSPTTFLGDADIQYSITNQSGQKLNGVFKNGYHGLHSTSRWTERQEKIQSLINTGWYIEEDVILASLEFLFSGNYRMAVFNAATVLELSVVNFWEEKQKQLAAGSRQDQERVARLEREFKDKSKKGITTVEKILSIALPEFVEQSLITDGTLDHCIQAWAARNDMAHLYKLTDEGKQQDISVDDAWSAVSSIVALLDWFMIS